MNSIFMNQINRSNQNIIMIDKEREATEDGDSENSERRSMWTIRKTSSGANGVEECLDRPEHSKFTGGGAERGRK